MPELTGSGIFIISIYLRKTEELTMKKTKIAAWVLVVVMTAVSFTGCGAGSSTTVGETTDGTVSGTRSETSAEIKEETLAETSDETESEAKDAEQQILQKGQLLFSGNTNEGYYPEDEIDWLKSAKDTDAIAIIYACDDLTHGGWGVLGLGCNVEGMGRQQMEIAAYADMPDKERLLYMTMEELAGKLGGQTVSDLTSFDLGAWNGGRIAGLYFLSGDVAVEMKNYLEEAEAASAIKHTYDGSLSNPNAIENAVAVYDYLKDTWGNNCLTGQMESTWMGSPDYEMNYLEKNTGRLPAIRGLDFMHNDFAGVVTRAKEWWDKGGIVTICWHTGADFASGYNESKSDNINWKEAFTEGTETYNALIAGMDRAVPYLQELEDAGVPVLWRPFHELDGGWFWWSKGGSENFVKLWQMMYNHYTVDCGLDNLIWVYGYSGNGIEMKSWYPGDEYVDLIGADSYTKGANKNLYEGVAEIAAEGMPIVFHECGTIPTEAEMKEAGTDWLFFMTWHTDYLTSESNNTIDSLKEIYNSEYFITLDELPSFR